MTQPSAPRATVALAPRFSFDGAPRRWAGMLAAALLLWSALLQPAAAAESTPAVAPPTAAQNAEAEAVMTRLMQEMAPKFKEITTLQGQLGRMSFQELLTAPVLVSTQRIGHARAQLARLDAMMQRVLDLSDDVIITAEAAGASLPHPAQRDAFRQVMTPVVRFLGPLRTDIQPPMYAAFGAIRDLLDWAEARVGTTKVEGDRLVFATGEDQADFDAHLRRLAAAHDTLTAARNKLARDIDEYKRTMPK